MKLKITETKNGYIVTEPKTFVYGFGSTIPEAKKDLQETLEELWVVYNIAEDSLTDGAKKLKKNLKKILNR